MGKFIVRYLIPMEKRFNKKIIADRFMRNQFQVLEFIEKKDGQYHKLQIPVGVIRDICREVNDGEV